MPISYVEELASEYYRLSGYFTQRDYHYRREIIKEGKGRGWRDIDILAVNANEVLIIECKAQVRESGLPKKIIEDMKHATKEISKINLLKGKTIRKILVYDSVRSVGKQVIEVKKAGIDVVDLQDIVKKMLIILNIRKSENNENLGKEENVATRTLLAMLDWDLIKSDLTE